MENSHLSKIILIIFLKTGSPCMVRNFVLVKQELEIAWHWWISSLFYVVLFYLYPEHASIIRRIWNMENLKGSLFWETTALMKVAEEDSAKRN